MSHAYARNYVHVIFSTRERHRKILAPIQPEMWAYIGGIARNYGIELVAIGGTEDHVHLVLALPPKLSLAHAIRAIKANSSKWMNETGHLFAWQDGYGAFSVSASNLPAVVEYVEHQAAHHARRNFAEEFRSFLEKHGIEYDPGYLGG
jgi:REP element-mobilizing transposase RayT